MSMALQGGDLYSVVSMLIEQALLLLFILNQWPSSVVGGGSRYTTTSRKSSSSKSGRRSKAKASKEKSRRTSVGYNPSVSALIITAIIIAGIVVLVAAYWWWQRRRTRSYIRGTEKLATLKYSIGAQARDIGEPVRLFSHAEVKRATNGFASDRVLGRGRFGDVYKGILDDETQVAIKSVKAKASAGKDQLLSEVQALSKVSHPNLVHLLGFCVRWKCLLLVYEYVPNGSLSGQLVAETTILLDWKTRLQIAQQSAEALVHLHSRGPIYHTAVKSNNILLDQSMNAKLSDYGLAGFGGGGSGSRGGGPDAPKPVQFSKKWPWINISVRKSPGTFAESQAESAYLDIEYQNNDMNQLTNKSDVGSFGMILLELVTSPRALMFASGHEDSANLVEMVRVKKEQGKLDDVLNAELLRGASEATTRSMSSVVDLALECLHEDGVNRPLMEEVAERLQKIVASLEEPQQSVPS